MTDFPFIYPFSQCLSLPELVFYILSCLALIMAFLSSFILLFFTFLAKLIICISSITLFLYFPLVISLLKDFLNIMLMMPAWTQTSCLNSGLVYPTYLTSPFGSWIFSKWVFFTVLHTSSFSNIPPFVKDNSFLLLLWPKMLVLSLISIFFTPLLDHDPLSSKYVWNSTISKQISSLIAS